MLECPIKCPESDVDRRPENTIDILTEPTSYGIEETKSPHNRDCANIGSPSITRVIYKKPQLINWVGPQRHLLPIYDKIGVCYLQEACDETLEFTLINATGLYVSL